MTPAEAIVAATSKAADCLERSDIGALRPGNLADVLVVEGDPLQDIRVLQNREALRMVLKGGKTFDNPVASRRKPS